MADCLCALNVAAVLFGVASGALWLFSLKIAGAFPESCLTEPKALMDDVLHKQDMVNVLAAVIASLGILCQVAAMLMRGN